MKTLLLKDSSLRVSVMSFHHEIVYSVMRAYFEALVSHVLIWNERSYGLLWNTEMVEDISERLRFFSKDTKRWRVYASASSTFAANCESCPSGMRLRST